MSPFLKELSHGDPDSPFVSITTLARSLSPGNHTFKVMFILQGGWKMKFPSTARRSPKGIIIFVMLGINLEFSLDCIKDKVFLDFYWFTAKN